MVVSHLSSSSASLVLHVPMLALAALTLKLVQLAAMIGNLGVKVVDVKYA